jgi:hypothetical protein
MGEKKTLKILYRYFGPCFPAPEYSVRSDKMSSSMARPVNFFLINCVFGVLTAQSVAQLRLPFQQRQPEIAAKSSTGAQVLSEASGPWLIMCASFAGQNGMQEAQHLAEELHSDHGLNAYVYRHQFDIEKRLTSSGIGQTMAQRAQDGLGPGKLKLASAGQFEEVAVLVGDFPSLDDGRAQQVLSVVKSYQPTVRVSTTEPAPDSTGDRVRAFRDEMTDELETMTESEGPLRLAFLLPNPMLPDAYFNREVVDDFVVKLNKGAKFNLLKNPGNYTVKVATFSGGTKMLNDSVSEKLRAMKGNSLFRKSKKASDLETALLKATVLARYLRKHEKLEAYEYHDREASYVCIGSFDWATRQTALGSETNPELKKVVQKFTGSVQDVTKQGIQAKSFPLPNKLTDVGIACSAAPEVIAVPKAKSSSVASRLMDRLR